MRSFRLALALSLVLASTACGWLNPFAPSTLKSTDAISYQVSGTGVAGNTIIVNYTVPVSVADPLGVRQETKTLPFASTVLGGYSLFAKQGASITATADGSPGNAACLNVDVLANGDIANHAEGCGQHVTVTAHK